ncbi:hypothetical protein [Paraprevotella clara]
MITIYGSDGIAKAQIATDDNSTQVKEIQGDNILTMSFTLYEHIALEVNDYTEFQGERYWLMEQYKPEQLSTVEWKYDVKLYGIESLLKRFLVLNDTDGDDEPVFTLTAPPREHVALIVKSINNGMNNTTDWKVGTVEGTENIVIDYEGKYCDEALKEVAEKAGNRAEWWCEGQTVNVCRCEHGEEVTLAYGKGLTSLECDMADNVKFYTRLYPIGSSRNIDPERYGHSRLQLPNGEKHIDINVEKYGIWHHYEADAFADIYPKRIGTVTGVRSEQVTGEDGNPYKIYYFRDDSMGFDPNDYEIGEKVKRVSFQEGSELAGLGDEENGTYYFEVNFNSNTREFEIITIWPYDDDTQLPNDILIPKVGDKYILWNIRMPDEYYPLAEQEFKQAVDKYNEEHAIDVSCYKSPTDHVYIEEHGIDLYIGRRVRLESTKYFPETGFRNSRITKVTRKVNLPSQMDIEISDATSTGTMEAISDSITDAKNYVKTATSGSFPDLIRSWDNTYPTDNNVFSARRTLKEALSRLREDTAQEKIRFLKGADFGKYETGESGATVDGDGNAEWLTAVIRELLRSLKFVDGMTGEGWQLWMDALTGLSNLTIDKVTIRQTLVALELLIQKVRSIGGQFVVSAASGKIKTVAKDGDNYKITFEQDNEFVAHDLMRCAEFTGASLRGYWVEVSASDGNGITVPVSEFGGVEPKEGDECVLMGNTQNRLRQNLISIAATEDGQPRVDVLDGVCAKNFNDCLRVRLGNLDGISDSRFPADNQPHGNGLYGDNVYLMGTFVLTTGEDILTRFEITEGKIEAAVEGLRKDFTEDKSYLDNASFGNGMNKWDTENEATFFLLGSKWIWANGAPLSDKTNYATVKTDDGRTTVFIRNKYILQKHENFRFIPDYNDINDEGQKKPEAVYLSFFYRVAKAGRMIIKFEGLDKTGFENFNEFSYDGELDVTDGYQIFNHSGLWNGTGDFKLSFTGEIYLYMLVLSTDRAEALAYKYKTLFEQSEKLVKIAAANFDKDGNVIETSSIVTTAKYNELMSQYFDENGVLKNQAGLVTTAMANKLYAFDADGNIVSMINQTASDIKISAKNISLEGLVTANSNFKILENGSIETIKATIKNSELTDVIINGTLRTPFRDGYYVLSADGPLTVSTLGLQNNNNVVIPIPSGGWQTAVVIPFSSEYNGFRAIIMNDNWGADTSGGTLTHTAPSGKYYFENGVKKNTLEIPRNSGVEIIGYGEGDNFKGWIVLNRIYKSDHDNGFPLHVMFYGMVRNDSLVKIKKYHDENITFSKIGTGKYRITFGQAFSDKNNYTVLLTGFAEGTGRYASVSAQETTYFDVYTGDDDSPNDGGFQFLVINTAAMYV